MVGMGRYMNNDLMYLAVVTIAVFELKRPDYSKKWNCIALKRSHGKQWRYSRGYPE
jgi:hypothetical protein